MKHLFIARHGEDEDGRLSEEGRQQMEALGRAMKKVLSGGSAYIMSSTAQTSLESSRVLAELLGVQEEMIEGITYLGNGILTDHNKRLMELVNEKRHMAGGLVMVSNLETGNFFPKYFCRIELGVIEPHIENLGKGYAVHFDLEKRAYKILP